MNRKQLIGWLEDHDACGRAMDWICATPGQPGHLWRQVPRGEWLLWMHEEAGLSWEDRAAVTYEIADRAVRIVAPRALAAAGLHDDARALRALAPIVDEATAAAARYAADAADAASAEATDAAYAAAFATDAADAAASATDAAYAARCAAYAADVIAADAAEATDAEHKRHATMVRRHIRWRDIDRALEDGTL